MGFIAALAGKIKLSINSDDHNWPHLHMWCPEGIFKIRFADLAVTTQKGSARKAARQLETTKIWMMEHMDELYDRWQQRERGEKIDPID